MTTIETLYNYWIVNLFKNGYSEFKEYTLEDNVHFIESLFDLDKEKKINIEISIIYNNIDPFFKQWSFYEKFLYFLCYSYAFKNNLEDLKNKLFELKSLDNKNVLSRLFKNHEKNTILKNINFVDLETLEDFLDNIEENDIIKFKSTFIIPKNSNVTDEDLQIYGEFFDFSFTETMNEISMEQWKKFRKDLNLPNILFKENLNILSLTKEDLAGTLFADILNVLSKVNFTQDEYNHIETIYPYDKKALTTRFKIPFKNNEPLPLFSEAIGAASLRKKFTISLLSEYQTIYKKSINDILSAFISNGFILNKLSKDDQEKIAILFTHYYK